MPSNANDDDLNVLDSAARVFRERAKAGSHFQALIDDARPLLAASGATADVGPTRRNEMNAGSADWWDMSLLCTERLSRSVELNLPQIGDMPPQPPTIRGRSGAVLVSVVRRALFWYTSQLRTFHTQVAESAREVALAFQQIGTQQRRQRALMTEMQQRLTELERQAELNQAMAESGAESLRDDLNQYKNSSEDRFRELDGRIKSLEETHALTACRQQDEQEAQKSFALRFGEIEQTLAQINDALAGTGYVEKELSLNAEIKEIRQQVHEARTHVLRQELRLKMLVRELRRRAVPPADVAAVLVEEVAHLNDPLFVDHSASFRGNRAEIKKRLTVYLPYAQEAFAAAMKSPALDLGCGRGEWMELLGEAGIPGKGIDRNRDLVSACRERGLDAMEGDICQFLQTFPDESLSIVTGFHIVEHIPFPSLVELIDQTVRILKPGGIAIFETPNSKNLFVSSNNFYLDPTHLHPVPSEFLAFLVEARGLCDPKVMPLSPYPDYFHLPESECPAVRFINEQFFGPQEYGIVARKA